RSDYTGLFQIFAGPLSSLRGRGSVFQMCGRVLPLPPSFPTRRGADDFEQDTGRITLLPPPRQDVDRSCRTKRKHALANRGQKQMNEKNTSDDTYALGRRPEETRRLQVQAQVLNPSTRRLFEQARIRAGMKVLDLGSGAGDVALLLADMIGPSGTVVGVEINP